MDIRQLRALRAVGEHRSFSAAARALGTVQSNVSTHIGRLERELDLVLVDRATNELTPEGQLVAERSRRIDHELDALASDVAAMRDIVSGQVNLGVIGTTARWMVPALLDELDESFPEVRIVVRDATTSSLVPQLAGGLLDLAVLNGPIDDPDLSVRNLFDEERTLILPPDHPLGKLASVAAADLAGYPLLLPATGSAFRRELDEDAATAGVQLTARAEVDGVRLLASLAFAGYGAAILPATAVPDWLDGTWQRVDLTGFRRRSVGLARRRRGLPSAAERAVSATVRRVVETKAGHQTGIHLNL